jgi:dipeptidyl aminopeptidase/acylaminoacyl peptidase
MSKTRNFDVDALWALDRIGEPSLSPDGAQAVAGVTRHSMDTNQAQSSLWLFSTLGGAPRRLTEAGDKDGAPAWSPRGDLIAFTAKREQGGMRDDEPQLYVIAPDGGEARRVGQVPTGVGSFKWFPDGRRIAFVSWVWPDRKAAAQAETLKDFNARKETALVTEEGLYRFWDRNLPMGRVPHLHVMDVATGKSRDLFEGTAWELSRAEPDANCYDIAPDGRRIAFAFDPAAEKALDHRFALAEIDVKARQARVLQQHARRATAMAVPTSPSWPATRHWATTVPTSSPCSTSRASGPCSATTGITRSARRCAGRRTTSRCCSPPRPEAAATCGSSCSATAWPSRCSRAATSAASRWRTVSPSSTTTACSSRRGCPRWPTTACAASSR